MAPDADTPGLGTTAERRAVIAEVGAVPSREWVIVTRGLTRLYDMGGETVRALRGVPRQRDSGAGRRPSRRR